MNFSEQYFSRYSSVPAFFACKPETDVGCIVVIPCYDDDFIFATLDSLEKTADTDFAVEVIVVVNSGENTPKEIVAENKRIYDKLQQICYSRFRLLPILIENVPRKIAGVGNARKTGMDEAVRRFAEIDKPNGIIASLDADCLVSENYFRTIEKTAVEHPKTGGFVFEFRHNFDHNIYSTEEIEACRQYENYLRYYKSALQLTGFPHSFHTIGSCFAVRAEAYTKIGGMSRRQGGEDFYFLHKLAQMTEVVEIAETLVFPAPRVSDRVPFGTGPTVKNIVEQGDYRVYNFELFQILKRFFDCFDAFSENKTIESSKIPTEIINFTGEENLQKIFAECFANAKQGQNLKKRLFSKFDAFFVVKFLNSPLNPPQGGLFEQVQKMKKLSESGFTEF